MQGRANTQKGELEMPKNENIRELEGPFTITITQDSSPTDLANYYTVSVIRDNTEIYYNEMSKDTVVKVFPSIMDIVDGTF